MKLTNSTAPRAGVAVCIDDLGLHPGVTEAAIELSAAGRVSALACLTDAPAWPDAAAALRRVLRDRVDLGLHLNFTEPWSRSPLCRPLARFIAAAYSRRLDPAALRAGVRRQLDAFEDAIGATPDFVDGHQHVHQLPQVREALLTELCERYPLRKPWLRHTGPPARSRAAWTNADNRKHCIIAALGARPLRALARASELTQNGHLLGVYGFSGSASDFALRWQRWCAEASDGDLFMSHASGAVEAGSDPIMAAREAELRALLDASTWRVLDERGLAIVRLSQRAEHAVETVG